MLQYSSNSRKTSTVSIDEHPAETNENSIS